MKSLIISLKQFIRESWHFMMLLILLQMLRVKAKKIDPPLGPSLIIAPHPDDEIIGLGGFILANLEAGHPLHFLYLSDGEGSGVNIHPEKIRKERLKLSSLVIKSLGLPESSSHRFHLPDGSIVRKGEADFDVVADRVASLIEKLQPRSVFATHSLDYWPYDHLACAELAQAR